MGEGGWLHTTTHLEHALLLARQPVLDEHRAASPTQEPRAKLQQGCYFCIWFSFIVLKLKHSLKPMHAWWCNRDRWWGHAVHASRMSMRLKLTSNVTDRCVDPQLSKRIGRGGRRHLVADERLHSVSSSCAQVVIVKTIHNFLFAYYCTDVM